MESIAKGTRGTAPAFNSSPEEYNSLSQMERMVEDFSYSPYDLEHEKGISRGRELSRKFNQSESEEERNEIMRKMFNQNCKNNCIIIEAPFRVGFGRNISVGNNVYFNCDALILDYAPVEIGNYCLFGPGVHIYTASLPVPVHPSYREDLSSSSTCNQIAHPVKIGENCWIGGRSVICPGVCIGDNSIVGAGAVVTENVPPNCCCAGNPAKIIRRLDKPKN